MDTHADFRIFQYKDHYIVSNIKGDKSHHTHLKKYNTCQLIVRLVCTGTVPKSSYLRESAMRISRNEKYIQDIIVKKEKDKNKQKYYNVNNGRF